MTECKKFMYKIKEDRHFKTLEHQEAKLDRLLMNEELKTRMATQRMKTCTDTCIRAVPTIQEQQPLHQLLQHQQQELALVLRIQDQ